MTVPLVSLDEVKAYIPTNPGYSNNDAKYLMLAKQATAAIEVLCRTKFARDEYTQYFDSYRTGKQLIDLYGTSLSGYSQGTTPQFFLLKALPVDMSEPFTVYYDPDRQYAEASIISPVGYFVEEESGRLRIDSITDSYPRAFKVVYTAGYELAVDVTTGQNYVAGAPDDLKMACLLTIQYIFDKVNLRTTNSVQRGDTDNDSDTVAKGIVPQEAMNLLLQHKRYYVKRAI